MIFDPSKRFFPYADRLVDTLSANLKRCGQSEIAYLFISVVKRAVLGIEGPTFNTLRVLGS